MRQRPCPALRPLPCRYSQGVLIEVNAHSLFSKWFSESGKLVSRLFAKIQVRCAMHEGLSTRCGLRFLSAQAIERRCSA